MQLTLSHTRNFLQTDTVECAKDALFFLQLDVVKRRRKEKSKKSRKNSVSLSHLNFKTLSARLVTCVLPAVVVQMNELAHRCAVLFCSVLERFHEQYVTI